VPNFICYDDATLSSVGTLYTLTNDDGTDTLTMIFYVCELGVTCTGTLYSNDTLYEKMIDPPQDPLTFSDVYPNQEIVSMAAYSTPSNNILLSDAYYLHMYRAIITEQVTIRLELVNNYITGYFYYPICIIEPKHIYANWHDYLNIDISNALPDPPILQLRELVCAEPIIENNMFVGSNYILSDNINSIDYITTIRPYTRLNRYALYISLWRKLGYTPFQIDPRKLFIETIDNTTYSIYTSIGHYITTQIYTGGITFPRDCYNAHGIKLDIGTNLAAYNSLIFHTVARALHTVSIPFSKQMHVNVATDADTESHINNSIIATIGTYPITDVVNLNITMELQGPKTYVYITDTQDDYCVMNNDGNILVVEYIN
jgi:hypothetical protein